LLNILFMQTGYKLKTFALLTYSCVHLTELLIIICVTLWNLLYEIYGDVQMQLDYYTL